MSLKESLEKIKASKEGLRQEVQDTRQMVKDVRPKPFRNILDRKMSELRPFRRVRRRLSDSFGSRESKVETEE